MHTRTGRNHAFMWNVVKQCNLEMGCGLVVEDGQ